MDNGMAQGTPAIYAHGLRKTYGQHEAVKGVDLSIGRGEIVGFLGPNGAGKTTTIKMLTGLLKPSMGTAAILGHDIERDPIAAKAAFGYVPDTPNLYGKLRGWEYLRFMARLYRVPTERSERRAAELLRLFDLTGQGCDSVGSVLLNDILVCGSQEADARNACVARTELASRVSGVTLEK